jgi:hypothetical protein
MASFLEQGTADLHFVALLVVAVYHLLLREADADGNDHEYVLGQGG